MSWLLSILEDCTLVEFDVVMSSVASGLVLKNIVKIEQVAVLTPWRGIQDWERRISSLFQVIMYSLTLVFALSSFYLSLTKY
jgi:hypothetical protein